MSNQRVYAQGEGPAGQVLYISTSRYEGDWHSTLHMHHCTEVFLVTGGKGQVQVENKTFAVKKGDMVFIPPEVRHTENGIRENPLEYIVLGATGDPLPGVLGQGQRQYYVFPSGDMYPEMLGYFLAIQQELTARAAHYEMVCSNWFSLLILKLLRRDMFAKAQQAAPAGSKECAFVKSYLDEHYTETITLDDLAEAAHLNKYYLSHTFSRAYGVSPINYLIRRRIEESRYLLTNTDHSISQISQILGFSSPSYFSQSFRQAEKMSPREYRQDQHARTRG